MREISEEKKRKAFMKVTYSGGLQLDSVVVRLHGFGMGFASAIPTWGRLYPVRVLG